MASERFSAGSLQMPLQPRVLVPSGLPTHPSPHVRSQLASPSATSPSDTTSPLSAFSPSSSISPLSTTSPSSFTSRYEFTTIKPPKLARRPTPLKLDDISAVTALKTSPKLERTSSIVRIGRKLKDIRACFAQTPTPTEKSKPVVIEATKAQKTKKKKKKTTKKIEVAYEEIGDSHWADDY